MAKLILKFNDEVIDHIELKQGDMKIGRKPTNDIFLDNLAISGEHANIFTIGEDSFVQDLGSTNGTFVNNRKITKHHLKNGDVVSIGKHSLIFFAETVRENENTEDFAKTVILSPGSSSGAVVNEPVPATATPDFAKDTMNSEVTPKPGQADRQGAIFVLSGPNSGRRLDLNKSVTNLGKTGKVAGTISRTPDGYRLASSGGADTPLLNGRAAPAGEGMLLKNGDIIEVAGTRLQFYLK